LTSDKITLILLNTPRSEPRSISISKRKVMVGAVLLTCFLAFSVFSMARGLTGIVRRANLRGLERENQALKAEIAELGQKVADFEKQMAGHVEFEEQLRILAGLEPMDEDIWKVGVGGPELLASSEVGAPLGRELGSLNDDVDRLLRQIRLQRHSFDEILSRLRDKSDQLSHLPSIRPVDVGYISSGFGKRRDPFSGKISRHEGVDFSARKGSNIYATADGIVTLAKYDRGYGYTIEIDHGNGIVTKYAHNSKLLVKKGQRVKRGDVVAYLGDSGRSTAPHLHYEVRVNGIPKNPLDFILPSDIVVD
jgi:murein DD-endopeptidase MepM/ murein hydrolase activator NlpD